jgi:3-deoxy-D-manno-octulosonic-acid transferase
VIFVYNIILYPLFFIMLPLLLLAVLFDKKWRTDLIERFGVMDRDTPAKFTGKKVIWFHAASVGEVQALAPVAREMKALKKDHEIIITSTSINGKKKIQKELQDLVFFSSLLPFDIGIFMDPFIDKINPEIVVFVETELWPNFISLLSARGIPMVLMNGRVSIKSFRFYYPLRFFFGPLLKKFSLLIMQSEKMVKRLDRLGVTGTKTLILGNTKFSSGGGDADARIVKLDDKKGKKIIIAGSVREGEESLIIDAFEMIKNMNCVLILAPRRLKRAAVIEKILVQKGMKYAMWSEIPDRAAIPDYDVIILNTMGDLSYVYNIGDIAVIGGGFKKFGGHNPMEPASAGLPIIMGRHMYNFEDTADKFVKGGGAYQVDENPAAIAGALKELIENDGARLYKGEKNRHIIENFKGSASTTAVIINEIMIESARGRLETHE